MITRTYINRRDNNKYLLIRKYDDGHTVAKQFIEWSNGVRNYTGASLWGRGRFGRFSRVTKHFFREVVYRDYELLNEGKREEVHGRGVLRMVQRNLHRTHRRTSHRLHQGRQGLGHLG